MTIKEAIIVLKYHNDWRRGAEMPMAEPSVIGKAIDVIIEYLENKNQTN